MKLGCHVSIADSIDKSVDRATNIGCNTFQIFTRNPRRWKYRPLSDEEVKNFQKKIYESDIWPVFSHMPYLPNLSSLNPEVYLKSVYKYLQLISKPRKLMRNAIRTSQCGFQRWWQLR